jgi:hypothetical protein
MMKPMYQVVVNDPQAMMEMNAALTRMAPTHAKICSALEEHSCGWFLLTSLMMGCAEMKREVVSQRKIILVASIYEHWMIEVASQTQRFYQTLCPETIMRSRI